MISRFSIGLIGLRVGGGRRKAEGGRRKAEGGRLMAVAEGVKERA